MRKLIMFFVIGFFAFGMAAGSVWGSQLDIAQGGTLTVDYDGSPSGPAGGAVTVAEEILNVDREADLENGSVTYQRLQKRDILYVPTVSVKEHTSIEITLTNGAIKTTDGNVMYLLLKDNNPECSESLRDESPRDAVVAGTMTDYVLNAAGTGYSAMLFQFAKVDRNGDCDTDDEGEDTIFSNEVLSISTTRDITQCYDGKNGECNCSYDDYSPTIIINKGLKKDEYVYMQVTDARDNNNHELNAPQTGPEAVVRVVEGIITTLTQATSVIDAQDSRLSFVDEGNPGDATYQAKSDTDLLISTARDLHVDEELAEIGFDLDGNDTYTLSITRTDATGVTRVEWSGQTGTHTAGTTTWSKTGNFGDFVGQRMLKKDLDIEIITGGMAPGYLQVGDWYLTLIIDTDDVATVNDQTELDNAVSHDWDINGMQVKIPYIVFNATGYLSFVKVANEGPTDAEMQADAIIWNVTDNPGAPESATLMQGVDVKVIPAISITTVSEAEFNTALGLDDTKLYHVELTLTVVAPQNSVHVAAFQKSPDGRTDIPVLYNVNNQDGRQWQ